MELMRLFFALPGRYVLLLHGLFVKCINSILEIMTRISPQNLMDILIDIHIYSIL